MNYAEMSDFEINCSVARALGEVFTIPSKGKVNHYLDVTDTTISLLNCDGTRVERVIVRDYCNNPADAWPIIEGNYISTQFQQGNWMASVNPSQETGFRSACFIEKKSPLRAAMVVFLMMKEGE